MDYLPLEDCLDTLIDYRGKTPKKTESGIRLITAKVIKKGTITDNSFEYIAENEYDSWMRRGLPVKGDVLLTTEAPLGEVAQIRSSEKIALAQRVILLRANPEILDQDYLLFAMQSHVVQGELNARATGTTVAGIKQSELRKVLIPIPPIKAQREIGLILHNYDNLIENNNRRIAILENMAQSLYREWFVNFRYPNHQDNLDADGKPKLTDSPLGQIPEGWEVKKFSEVVNYKTGRLNSNAAVAGGEYPFFTCSRETFRTNTWSFDCECVLLAGNNANAIYPIKYFNGKFDAYQRTYVITEKNRDVITPSFLFYCLEIKLNQLKNISTGTSTRFLTKGILDNLDLLIPAPELMSQFNLIVLSLLNSQGNLRKRNENLKQQRDMLLPKLISGQIEL